MIDRVRIRIDAWPLTSYVVQIEPHATEIHLKESESLTIEMKNGNGLPDLELTYGTDGVTIWAWDGAAVVVRDQDGYEIPI